MSLFKRIEVDNRICAECGTKKLIKSLLGSEIEIVKIEKPKLLLRNNKIIIDVWFNKAYISPIKTYYIDKTKLKQNGDYKDLYIFELEKQPVLLRLNKATFSSSEKTIPVHIRPLLSGNRNYYHYYAEYQRQPLHGYSTILKNKFSIPSVEVDLGKIEHSKAVKELFTEKETVENYEKELRDNTTIKEILGPISSVKVIKNFDETKNSGSGIAYVLSDSLLPKTNINGHILIIPNRKTDLICYYPNVANMIYYDEICFIHKFIEFDKTNLP